MRRMSQDDGMMADMRMLGLLDLADAKISQVEPIIGHEDMFYERICRSDTKVRFIPTSSRDILYQDEERRNQTDFLRRLVMDDIHIDDLLTNILEKYGILFDRAKVIEKIKSSDMYYIPEMERIFVDKQVFLNKIYDKE